MAISGKTSPLSYRDGWANPHPQGPALAPGNAEIRK
jgi:hypothetical protein